MTHEKVDEMLRAYREIVGRCGYLEVEINRLEKAVKQELTAFEGDVTSIKSPDLSGLPHGTMIGSQTERLAIILASGIIPDEIREMQKMLEKAQKEYEQKHYTVLCVDAWLNGLQERERWLIEHQVIDGEFWKNVINDFNDFFGDELSKDSLKRLKQRALTKIYIMAE